MKFLLYTGAQVSVFTQQDAQKLGVQPVQQRFKITGVNCTSVVCRTTQVNLWLTLLILQFKIIMETFWVLIF